MHEFLRNGGVLCGIFQCLAQQFRFALQGQVLVGQLPVHVLQMQICPDVIVQTACRSNPAVGRTEPHASLIAVKTKQQNEAERFKQQKKQDVTVFTDKVEQIVHRTLIIYGLQGFRL